MKTGWLLYDRSDYEANQWFAEHTKACGKAHGIAFTVVFTETIDDCMTQLPDFVISRQRNPQLSARLEALMLPVFNNARVCEICNDKRKTHRFLEGLPRMQTQFTKNGKWTPPPADAYPLVVKPAFGHGGDRVQPVNDPAELEQALAAIKPQPVLIQAMASGAGCDLRVYVLFGKIIAAVMRTANEGIVSNFKRGGHVALHTLTEAERDLAQKVIDRFADVGAPLSFAGIDLIYHHGQPVVNEVEDVVGSRMLYQVSKLDSIAMYIEAVADKLLHDKTANL